LEYREIIIKEQGSKEKAEYGAGLLKELSRQMSKGSERDLP